jgi:hypothetical protein
MSTLHVIALFVLLQPVFLGCAVAAVSIAQDRP